MNEHVPLIRRSGLAMTWQGDSLRLWSQRKEFALELNRTAASVWLLCDGQRSGQEIADYVLQNQPDPSAQMAEEVLEVLADFHKRGLVTEADGVQPPRPFVQVGFCNFWPQFDPTNNFFLWMLTYRFDVLLVDPLTAIPALLFYSTIPSFHYDHQQADRTQTLKILFFPEEGPPDFAECDYVFSLQSVAERFTEQQYQLPQWSLYLDWDRYEQEEAAAFGHHSLPDLAKPQQACTHLYTALAALSDTSVRSEKEVHTEEDRSLLQAPAPHPMTAPIGEQKPLSDLKVLAITTSYKRVDRVYATILQMRLQSYPVFHSVRINLDDQENEAVARTILNRVATDQMSIIYRHNEHQHTNHLSCIEYSPVQDWDLILKIDDDDLYLPEYVHNVVVFHQQHPEVHISTARAEGAVLKGTPYAGSKESLAGGQGRVAGQDHYAMSSTIAFTRRAYDVIRHLPEPSNMWEDQYWQESWQTAGLIHRQRPIGAADWVWNVHGNNTTTSEVHANYHFRGTRRGT